LNFEVSDEQEALLGAVVRFLSERMPVSRLRRSGADGPENCWREIAELGLFALTATTEEGGMGLSLVDEALLFREFGRYLVTPCVLATVIGRRVAMQLGQGEVASRMMSGDCQVAFAFENLQPAGGDDRRILLLDAQGADQILLVSQGHFKLVQRSLLNATTYPDSLDESIPIQEAHFDSSVAGISAPETSLAFASLAGAMLVGIAEAALGAAVGYAKERQQFGAPIGSFQAIKHLCADNAVLADAAWSQTLWSAIACQEKAADSPLHTAAAILLSDDAARHASQDNIQIHGGMGFTAECDAHRYAKRRHVLSRIARHSIDAHSLITASATTET
jgi:alkylation response protein AidB-like acyl-CoA dehydrogenase